MQVNFKTEYLSYLYFTPLEEIKGKLEFSKLIIKQYKKKVQLLNAISNLEQLKQFGGLNFENLKGDRKGEYSIRLNNQYRLIFEQINENEIAVLLLNEISKHYE
jgi:toxin HigB-1